MFLKELEINAQSVVSDIVKANYRTADVFQRYGIEYCCGAKWPLSTVCMMRGIEENVLLQELKKASRSIQLPSILPFENWSVDFLTDYIVNIHHYYLDHTLPSLGSTLQNFVAEHIKKYPSLGNLLACFDRLHKEIIPHIRHEEEIIFPYIRQVAHAYEDKNSYARLLVKTLRKPLASVIKQEEEIFATCITKFRELTDNYTPPEKACTSHKVAFSKLKELDMDLVQHFHLENNILFPRIMAMEKDILGAG